MKFQPGIWLSFCTRMRATPSTEPPAGNGTTMVPVRDGKVCDCAGCDATAASATTSTKANFSFIAIPFLERTRITAAIDHQVLPRNVARVRRAQKGAIGAKLLGIAVAPGRVGDGALAPDFVEALAGRRQHALDVAPLRAAVEDAGQQVVDRDVARD